MISQPWFSTHARRVALIAEGESWLRTPFCLHAQAKGGGVDCVHLVHALASANGWPHALVAPYYEATDTQHSDDSKLHDYLDTAAGIELVGEFPAIADHACVGDLVTIRIGRAAHHLGMMITSRRFIHVMSQHFVDYSDLADGTWSKRACRLYRLVDVTRPLEAEKD
jgi:cell wall-associated NlpC family hydrolase